MIQFLRLFTAIIVVYLFCPPTTVDGLKSLSEIQATVDDIIFGEPKPKSLRKLAKKLHDAEITRVAVPISVRRGVSELWSTMSAKGLEFRLVAMGSDSPKLNKLVPKGARRKTLVMTDSAELFDELYGSWAVAEPTRYDFVPRQYTPDHTTNMETIPDAEVAEAQKKIDELLHKDVYSHEKFVDGLKQAGFVSVYYVVEISDELENFDAILKENGMKLLFFDVRPFTFISETIKEFCKANRLDTRQVLVTDLYQNKLEELSKFFPVVGYWYSFSINHFQKYDRFSNTIPISVFQDRLNSFISHIKLGPRNKNIADAVVKYLGNCNTKVLIVHVDVKIGLTDDLVNLAKAWQKRNKFESHPHLYFITPTSEFSQTPSVEENQSLMRRSIRRVTNFFSRNSGGAVPLNDESILKSKGITQSKTFAYNQEDHLGGDRLPFSIANRILEIQKHSKVPPEQILYVDNVPQNFEKVRMLGIRGILMLCYETDGFNFKTLSGV